MNEIATVAAFAFAVEFYFGCNFINVDGVIASAFAVAMSLE